MRSEPVPSSRMSLQVQDQQGAPTRGRNGNTKAACNAEQIHERLKQLGFTGNGIRTYPARRHIVLFRHIKESERRD